MKYTNYEPKIGKYRAYINLCGKKFCLGYFSSEQEAAFRSQTELKRLQDVFSRVRYAFIKTKTRFGDDNFLYYSVLCSAKEYFISSPKRFKSFSVYCFNNLFHNEPKYNELISYKKIYDEEIIPNSLLYNFLHYDIHNPSKTVLNNLTKAQKVQLRQEIMSLSCFKI